MNPTIINLLSQLKTDLLNSMQAKGRSATGQTAQQITITATGDNAQLEIPGYLQTLENGRGPTSKNAAPGSPPMIQRIRQWCQAKGIPDKAAWAIKKSIDKKGFPGTPGILTGPLGDDNIGLRVNQTLNTIVAQAANEIANELII